jgi:DNA invertase Pin-like site-specific DNA recombinase
MIFGYARISTVKQNLDIQREQLKKAGCQEIFCDIQTGKDKSRPGLNDLMKVLRSDDSLIVVKLDRLARSMRDLLQLIEEIAQKNVFFMSLGDQVDTSTPAGRFFIHIIGSLGEMERELIRERTIKALEHARTLGKIGGRRKTISEEKENIAISLLNAGNSYKTVAETLKINLKTLYRIIPSERGLEKKSV